MSSFPYSAIAISRYRSPPTDAQPFSLNVGDQVEVLALADEEGDWIRGTKEGKEGVFPVGAVERVVDEAGELGEVKSGKEAEAEKETIPVDSEESVPTPAPTPIVPPPSAPTPTSTPTPTPAPTVVPASPPKESKTTPLPPTKPTSLKERIAALNAAGAGAVAPGIPPKPSNVIPKGKPFVLKKPSLPPPPPSPSASPSTSTPSPIVPAIKVDAEDAISAPLLRASSREKDGEGMSASDAAASIGKAGSLRERIAALQGLKLDAPNALTGRPPKPWKKKSVDVGGAAAGESEAGVEDGAAASITGPDAVDTTKEEDSKPKQDPVESSPLTIAQPAAPALSLSLPIVNPSPPAGTASTSTSPLSAPIGSAGGMSMPSIPRRAGPPRTKAPSPSAPAVVPAVEEEEKKVEGVAEEKVDEEKVEEIVEKPKQDVNAPNITIDESKSVKTVVPPKEVEETESKSESDRPPTPIVPSSIPTAGEELAEKDDEKDSEEEELQAIEEEVEKPTEKKSTRPPIPASFAQTRIVPTPVVAEEEKVDEKEEEEVEADDVKEEGELVEREAEENEDSFEIINPPSDDSPPSPAPALAANEESEEPSSKVDSPPPTSTRAAPPPSRQLPPLQPITTHSAPSRDAPPTPTTPRAVEPPAESLPVESKREEVVVEEAGVAEVEEQTEEDAEVARRAALAKRMAKLGGMKMGMFPVPAFAPRSPVTPSSPSVTTQSKSIPAEQDVEEETVPERVPGSIPTGGIRLPIAPPRNALPSIPIAKVVDPEEEVGAEVKDGDDEVDDDEEEVVELEEEEGVKEEEEESAPPLPTGRPTAPPPAQPTGLPPVDPISDEEEAPEESPEIDERQSSAEEVVEEEESAPPPPPRSYPRPPSSAIPPPPSESLTADPASPISSVPRGALPALPILTSAGTDDSAGKSAGGGGFLDSVVIPTGGMDDEAPIDDEPTHPLSTALSSLPLTTATASSSIPTSVPAAAAAQNPRTPTESELEHFSTTLGAQIFAAAHLRLHDKSSKATGGSGGGGGGGQEFIDYCFSRAPDALRSTVNVDAGEDRGEEGAVVGGGCGNVRVGAQKFNGLLIYAHSFPPPTPTVPKPTSTTFIHSSTLPRSGDIILLRSTKFKKGLTTVKIGGSGEKALVGVVSGWDEKKRKVSLISGNEGGGGGVGEGSWRVDELRSGEIEIYRVLPRSWGA